MKSLKYNKSRHTLNLLLLITREPASLKEELKERLLPRLKFYLRREDKRRITELFLV